MADWILGHGLSAASGKVGAVLAQALAGPLRGIGFEKGKTDASPWLPHVIQILGAFAFLGLLCSFLIPETMNRSLEKLAGEEPTLSEGLEDEKDDEPKSFREYLWVSCTPYVLCQWLFTRRATDVSEEAPLEGGEGETSERISLSRLRPPSTDSLGQRDSAEAMLPGFKADEGLKVLESEIDRISGESSDRRSPDDEIRRIG